MSGPFPTVEARWFLRGPVPEAAAAWFDRLGAAVPPERRTDRYLAPAGDGLGVKVRDGNLETKRRAAVLDPLRAGPAAGAVEAWTKWSFPLAEAAAPEAGWVRVEKERRNRRAEAGRGACALEVAEVTVRGETWWSVCLEAYGRTSADRLDALRRAADRWLDRDDAPALPPEAAMGYPAWLRLGAGT